MNVNIIFKDMRKAILLSASFLLIFNACRKDGELVPQFQDNMIGSVYTDTLELNTTTRRGDSVLADKIATGLVGIYVDSAFGKTTSNVYVQPLLPSNALIFFEPDENYFVDSVVLSLEYSGYYGDTTVQQTFDVFRVADKLSSESNYYSDTNITVDPTMVGSLTFTPSPNVDDTILVPNNTGGIDTVSLRSQVRIRLDNSIGTDILSKSGGSEVENNANFSDFFRGLKVEPRDNSSLMDNEAAILYFGLTSSNTSMRIYYKTVNQDNDTTNRSANFPINNASVRFNTFKHDYTGSAVENVLNNPSQTLGFAYTQAMAGVETVIQFPTLKSAFSGKIIVNKAELVIPASLGSYSEAGIADAIVAAARNEEGKLQFIPDAFESAEYFGGQYDESTNSYTFNISRYIQGVLNGNITNNGLTILVTGSAVKAERAVFLTENNTDKKIKLNLYYTNTK